MITKVLDYVKKYRMIEEGDTIVAGVSGGADSVCLLFVLLHIREIIPFRLAVVHVNHGIRKDAWKDAEYVRSLCDKLCLPFYLTEKRVKEEAKALGISEEEAGRKIRYQAFAQTLQKETETGNGKIAVAHNSNDRAETMLFHLFRGTGLTGAGGIRPVNGNIIRPLLCVEREEIESFLLEKKISYCCDGTNEQDIYTRNRIRHHILPFAEEEICKGAVAHMNRAADDFLEAEEFIRRETVLAGERCIAYENGQSGKRAVIHLPLFFKEDTYLQGRILLSCLEEVARGRKDITSKHVEGIRKLMQSAGSKEISLPYGITVSKEYDTLILEKNSRRGIEGEQKEYAVSIPGSMEVPGLGNVEITVFPREKTENIPQKTYTKWFDYDKITGSVAFRIRKAGDYLTVNNRLGRKSLQDYFVNEKIPKADRNNLYVLADGAHILWVPGHRISEYYKVSDTTETVLQVRVNTPKDI